MCCSCVIDTLSENDLSTTVRAKVRLGQCGARNVVIKEVIGKASLRNLMEIKNRNIIQFFHHCSNIQVMDLADNGTLASALDVIVDKKEEIARQISSGLVYLHRMGIIHKKITTSNILLTRNLDARIGGFGSDDVDCIDKKWMAPELSLVPPKYSPASDIFALGVVMQEMQKMGAESADYMQWMIQCMDNNPNSRPLECPIPELFSETDENSTAPFAQDGLPALERLARAGSGVVANMLGKMYQTGTKVPMDKEKALEWFLEGAKNGNEHAQVAMGEYYQNNGDYPESEKWYLMAAEQGHDVAWCCLGSLFTEQSRYKEAEYWYSRAELRGIAEAQIHLGISYLLGYVQQDDSKAFQMFQKAADQGHPDGEFRLGCMYQGGRGTECNYFEAQKLFLKAAEKNHLRARLILGPRLCPLPVD
ncbi:hypothetical protein BGX27_008606 [Mortierella sp. AM989]|nr:hypothetical protein BGX27_008606 [Mortierella sp. AM989]